MVPTADMRFPSLFRLPRNQQFDIKPRYYDPVKEFVDERRALANKEARREEEADLPSGNIRFERRKSSVGVNTALLQLVIALVLSALIVGWLFLGNDIVYFGLILVPVYLYFRLKRR